MNHGADPLEMSKAVSFPITRLKVFGLTTTGDLYFTQFNKAAKKIARAAATKKKPPALSMKSFGDLPKHRVLNLETSVYIQHTSLKSKKEAIRQAMQAWYNIGMAKYKWGENVKNNLEDEAALIFARMIWKTNEIFGVAVAQNRDATYVVGLFYPGRNITNTDVFGEFARNVGAMDPNMKLRMKAKYEWERMGS